MNEEKTLTQTQTGVKENESQVQKELQKEVFTPDFDVFSDDQAFYLEGDLPGVTEKTLEITLEKNVLVISGKTEQVTQEGYTPRYGEYHVGDYERKFSINSDVDIDNIEAVLKNGVLKLTLPKKQPEQKKITVKAV